MARGSGESARLGLTLILGKGAGGYQILTVRLTQLFANRAKIPPKLTQPTRPSSSRAVNRRLLRAAAKSASTLSSEPAVRAVWRSAPDDPMRERMVLFSARFGGIRIVRLILSPVESRGDARSRDSKFLGYAASRVGQPASDA